jgi:hypothetical protein
MTLLHGLVPHLKPSGVYLPIFVMSALHVISSAVGSAIFFRQGLADTALAHHDII